MPFKEDGLASLLGEAWHPAYKQTLKQDDVSRCHMPMSKDDIVDLSRGQEKSQAVLIATIVAVQAVAAVYFLADGVDDILEQAKAGISFEVFMDCLVAIALIAGIWIGVRHFRKTRDEIRRKDAALTIARGALNEHMTLRFGEWGLTVGEAEVALFAMKGCNVSEIAKLRQAAQGTVRSQLSQIYAKAGVSSQSMFVSLFLEDLIDLPMGG